MDKLDWIGAPDGAAEDVAASQPVEAAPEPDGPARGADGKFVAKESDPTPAAAAPPEPPLQPEAAAAAQPVETAQPPVQPETRPDPTHVPLAVMLDERDRFKAEKVAREAAEERVRILEAQQQRQTPAPIPDRYEDPEGFDAYQAQQLDNRLFNERANFSERLARKDHGDEIVSAAQVWAQGKMGADPSFTQRVRSEADPYDFVVREYQRDQIASTLSPADFQAFQQWKAAQGSGDPPPVAAQPYVPPTPPPTPPRSLAAEPSAGSAKPGAVPAGPGEAFDATFK